MLFITRLLFIIFLSVGINYNTFAENFVCSHNFNGRNTINKYEKLSNSQYVQHGDEGEKFLHNILFENEEELHLQRRIAKFQSCTTTGQAITVINKQTLDSVAIALCTSIKSTFIIAKCMNF